MRDEPIPNGYCQCGCGERTSLAAKTRRGLRKGEPTRFVTGHNLRTGETPEERFERHVNRDGPVPQHAPYLGACWLWKGISSYHAYAVLTHKGKQLYAHRWSYEQVHGPIPKGLVLDHLCRVRQCVNPAHLEAVTSRVNSQRGARARVTQEQALEIQTSKLSLRALARIYGLDTGHLSKIRSGKAWENAGDLACYRTVLGLIAEGHEKPAELARNALDAAGHFDHREAA